MQSTAFMLQIQFAAPRSGKIAPAFITMKTADWETEPLPIRACALRSARGIG
jgi:hypothetical protein